MELSSQECEGVPHGRGLFGILQRELFLPYYLEKGNQRESRKAFEWSAL